MDKLAAMAEQIRQFCEERDWDPFHTPKDLAIGLVTEASELLDLFRFQTEDDMRLMLEDPERRESIADELADVLYFLLRFAQKYDFDLAREFERKMRKNARKYPVEASKGSNRKLGER